MIKNKGFVLAENSRFCKSRLSKAIGLMFHKKMHNTALVFSFNTERNVLLHMFFVFFPIDVAVLDKDKRVIQLKEHFMPFTFMRCRKARYIVELPVGTLRGSETIIGDVMDF